jgi:hypothetical protein
MSKEKTNIISDILCRGGFITSTEDNYKYIDENFDLLCNFFKKNNFILKHSKNFFYLSN